MSRIEELWRSKIGTKAGDEIDLFLTLVKAYQMKNYPFATLDPIDAIKFRREQMGMTKADMVKYLAVKVGLGSS